MKFSTSLRLWFLLLLLLASTRILAAQAAFSADGTHVFLAQDGLTDLDPATGKTAKIPLPEDIAGKNPEILALTRATDGALALLTAKRIFSYNPATHDCKELAAEPGEGYEFKDLACNPQDGDLYITARASGETEKPDKLICLVSQLQKTLPIVTRRIDYLNAPVFDSKGEFFFAVHGDLWSGGIDYETTSVPAPKADSAATTRTIQIPVSIHADRIAPLARLESYNGTPSATGVVEIAAADASLAVHTRRIGGSGWGKLLLLAKPAADLPRKDGEYPDFINLLGTVKILGENGTDAYLCAMPAGKIFYRAMPIVPKGVEAQTGWWIQDPNSAPRKIQ